MFGRKLLDHAGLIRVSIGAVAVLALGLFAFNGVSVVNRVDEASRLRDVAAFTKGLTLFGEVTASELVSVTVWDRAYRKVVQRRDPAWIRQTIGKSVYDDPNERVFIVSPKDDIAFSSVLDGVPPPDAKEDGLAAAAPQIAEVRALYKKSLVKDGDGFELKLTRPDAMFEGVYAHDIGIVDGRPALLTVSAFVPEQETDLITDKPPTVLVDIRRFEGVHLTKFAGLAQLGGVRVQAVATGDQDAPGRLVLKNRSGQRVGTATWAVEPPGSAVATAMLPMLAISAVLILILAAAASRILTSLARALADREALAVHAARHDPATGLANRAAFHDVMASLIQTRKPAALTGMVLIDLDYFKAVNDTLGHAAGDAVILAAAERMKTLQGETVVSARLGGDEFAVVTRPLPDAAALDAFCVRLHAELCQPVTFEEHVIPVGCSMGASLLSTSGQDRGALVHAADLALYRAKRDGRGCFRIFDPALDRETPTAADLKAVSSRAMAAPARDAKAA